MTHENAKLIANALTEMWIDDVPEVTIVYNANNGEYFLQIRHTECDDYYISIVSAFESTTSDYFPKQ